MGTLHRTSCNGWTRRCNRSRSTGRSIAQIGKYFGYTATFTLSSSRNPIHQAILYIPKSTSLGLVAQSGSLFLFGIFTPRVSRVFPDDLYQLDRELREKTSESCFLNINGPRMILYVTCYILASNIRQKSRIWSGMTDIERHPGGIIEMIPIT